MIPKYVVANRRSGGRGRGRGLSTSVGSCESGSILSSLSASSSTLPSSRPLKRQRVELEEQILHRKDSEKKMHDALQGLFSHVKKLVF